MQKADCPQRKRDILLLAQCILELPRVQKRVLALYYCENLPPTEIAACLGLTEDEIDLIRVQTVRFLETNYFAISQGELPLEEMSLSPKVNASASPRWQELAAYMREVHPAFHTDEDYRAALRFLILRYPKLQEILDDWNNN
jgi:hypothetical protein